MYLRDNSQYCPIVFILYFFFPLQKLHSLSSFFSSSIIVSAACPRKKNGGSFFFIWTTFPSNLSKLHLCEDIFLLTLLVEDPSHRCHPSHSMSEEKIYISYNNVHKLCQKAASQILETVGKPDVIVAIGGGGFIPSRIIRTFLRQTGEKNIPIQAIGLSLYEDLGLGADTIGKEVIRTQWLDFGSLAQQFDSLIGKNILIVDEVDDTRTTLHYALTELYNDVKENADKLGKTMEGTKFSIFVVNNKLKEKRADLNESLMNGGIYLAGEDVPDKWIAYPWESDDIDTHTANAIAQGNN